MLAPLFLPRLLALWWGALQGAPIDGTWELARIFRPGPASASRAVPIDSTVYVRLTLTTMPGDWIGGRLDPPAYGQEERAENQAGARRAAPPAPTPPRPRPPPPPPPTPP